VAQKRKKTSSKKTRPVRKKKNALTKADLEHFKQLLLAKRREILVNVNEIGDEALKKSRMDASGDLSSMPIHMADLGSDNFEQEFALGLLDSEVRILGEIDKALARIEEGRYGICEGTGVQIRKARLEAQPWARYCVDYARKLEQGLVVEEYEEQ
jgi:RNA polymerase-binding protein DksA